MEEEQEDQEMGTPRDPGISVKFVTSISPRRIDRQKRCIASWLALGFPVVAVQSPGEDKFLKPQFPGVEFVDTQLVGDLFQNYEIARIKPMIDQAVDEEVLILNSDIDIVSDPDVFRKNWTNPDNRELRVGIRWNRNPRTGELKMFKNGVDAFLITPDMAKVIPDIGLAIGKPAWDYFIPWHLVKNEGYKMTVHKDTPTFIHEEHPQNWSVDDYHRGLKLFETRYGIDRRTLHRFIQASTGRTHMP